MKITFENKDKPLMENMFVEDKDIGLYGWYGLTYFELGGIDFSGSCSWDGKEKLYQLRDCIDTMIKEIERLGV